jgi:hypothetical protein
MVLDPSSQDPRQREQREHDLTMHLFAISAGLVGVCLTAIGLLRLLSSHEKIETAGDELLATNAVLFMTCCFLSFWSFKQRSTNVRDALRRWIDGLFMLALALMVAVCALIAYAIV